MDLGDWFVIVTQNSTIGPLLLALDWLLFDSATAAAFAQPGWKNSQRTLGTSFEVNRPARINTAGVKELTELSRIAKNLAHRIVNRRKRHGKRHSRHAGGKKVG